MHPTQKSLTTALFIAGADTIVTHATPAKRDEYLRYNPDARIINPPFEEAGAPTQDELREWAKEDEAPTHVEPTLSEGEPSGPDEVEAWACPQCGRELPSADASCASCAPPATATYHRQEVGEWITVDAATDSLLRTTVRATSHGQFRDGTQITLSLLRKMDYFIKEIASPQPAYTLTEQNDVCWSCGDQLPAPTHGPALCGACQEAGLSWPDLRAALTQTAATVAIKQPAYTLTEQLEALRKEAHTARRQGLTEVVKLLKERACALAESYLDTGHMCDKGHWLNEYGQCETCLEAAQQLACARAHVNATIQQWQFEARTSDCPF